MYWKENWDTVIFIDEKDLIYMGQMAGNFSSITSKYKNIYFFLPKDKEEHDSYLLGQTLKKKILL